MFNVNIRQAGAYYPFAGIPSLEPKNVTCAHTDPGSTVKRVILKSNYPRQIELKKLYI